MKLKDVLEKTTHFFREKGFSSPRLDAELLLANALKVDRVRLYIDFERPLKEEELITCRELVRRRGLGEPVAYILKQKEFFGRLFEVGPGILIPRPETEHLVEAALDGVKKIGIENPRIVDLGCGSGCIGLTLLAELPSAELWAVDLSHDAIETTKRNANALGVGGRAFLAEGDAGEADALVETVGGAFDIVVANPPYIDPNDSRVEKNVKLFEPSSALFSGGGGLEHLTTWSRAFAKHLNSPGLMLMEIGADQGPAMKQHFEDLGIFKEVSILKDLAGLDRVVQGVRHG